MIIIGIDPGSNKIGVSIIEINNNGKILKKQWETIVLKGNTHLERLLFLTDRFESWFRNVVWNEKPELVCIEEPFIGKFPKTCMSMIQARGVLLSLILSRQFLQECWKRSQFKILEISPAEVKKGVSGRGNANKDDIQIAVKKVFDIPDKIPEDAADALAIAYAGWKMTTLE